MLGLSCDAGKLSAVLKPALLAAADLSDDDDIEPSQLCHGIMLPTNGGQHAPTDVRSFLKHHC